MEPPGDQEGGRCYTEQRVRKLERLTAELSARSGCAADGRILRILQAIGELVAEGAGDATTVVEANRLAALAIAKLEEEVQSLCVFARSLEVDWSAALGKACT